MFSILLNSRFLLSDHSCTALIRNPSWPDSNQQHQQIPLRRVLEERNHLTHFDQVTLPVTDPSSFRPHSSSIFMELCTYSISIL
jgi:hypothetical protein